MKHAVEKHTNWMKSNPVKALLAYLGIATATGGGIQYEHILAIVTAPQEIKRVQAENDELRNQLHELFRIMADNGQLRVDEFIRIITATGATPDTAN